MCDWSIYLNVLLMIGRSKMNERSSDIISHVMLFVADYLTMFRGWSWGLCYSLNQILFHIKQKSDYLFFDMENQYFFCIIYQTFLAKNAGSYYFLRKQLLFKFIFLNQICSELGCYRHCFGQIFKNSMNCVACQTL